MRNHFSDDVMYVLAICGVIFIIEHLIVIGAIIGMGVS